MSRRHWAMGLVGAVVVAGTTALVPTTATTAAAPAVATNADPALGNGLGRLLAKSEQRSFRGQDSLRDNQEGLTIRDAQGRVLVQLTPQSDANRAAFRRQAEQLGLVVQNVDANHGTLEGFAPLSAVRELAALKETGTLAQAVKPQTRAGEATSQGLALQRADKVHAKGIDGKGITIAALSDSYDTATTTRSGDPLAIHAAQDVASGDLPGRGNPRNRKPVVVVEDGTDPDFDGDEGRAMLQIAHDLAPGSKLCFATAYTGEIGFADNIRRLADKRGRCGADVVVDDIAYFSEPMFSDGPIGDAIDEVAAKGTHYFTAVGNEGVQGSWNSRVRLIPAERGLQGTNLDFSAVDPALYDGGLQDMNPGAGTDVAQDLYVGESGGVLNFQWDDPFDIDGATIGDPYFSATDEVTDANPDPSVEFTPTASQLGTTVLFDTDAIPTGTTDLILTVEAPDGTISEIDTGSSPEVLATTLDQSGTYTTTISGFDGDTGDFTLDISPVLSPSKVTTDFNLLVFGADGGYLGAFADQNPLSGRPSELGFPVEPGDIQLVVSRAGTGPVGATRMRHVVTGDALFTEYADPLSPAVWGHALAKGATAVAAYGPFRPFLPEPYTSPGGELPVFFDSAGNRFATPQIRRVPQVAGADRGNTTFFATDDARDADLLPNFAGTSASAPHVASIAALALQKAGGGRSYKPKELRTRLQESTFKHDLDPMVSSGTTGGLTVVARGAPGSSENDTTPPQSMVDPNFFTLSHDGRVAVKSVTFYGETASPTALGGSNPPRSDGIVFDPRAFDGETPFRTDGFPFTIGATDGGIAPQSVKATFSVPGGGESVRGQYHRMTLTFKSGLRRGQTVQFGVDRDLAISGFGGANEGNGADQLGGATFLPKDIAVPEGMDFSARLANGRTIRGTMSNRLGSGFTPVDGYGLVNAEEAALGR